MRITEGQFSPVRCQDKTSNEVCLRSGECVTQVIWNEAGKRLGEYLDSVTVQDLCDLAQKMGVKKEADLKIMYYI